MPYIKKSFIINIGLILLAIAVSYSAARMVRNAFIMRTQSAEMTKKIEELKQKKWELEAALAQIQTKEAVEREGKARMNLKKPGEDVVVVVPEKKTNTPIEQSKGFWATVISFFR